MYVLYRIGVRWDPYEPDNLKNTKIRYKGTAVMHVLKTCIIAVSLY